MSGVKLTQEARLDIRRDAERSCVGASVGDTLRLLDDYDALAQRCRELEQCMSEPLNKLVRERDKLRAEVEALRELLKK